MDSFHSCWRKWGGNQSWQNHWQRLIIVCSGDFSRLFCLISFFSSLTFFSPVIITFSIYWFRFSACNIRRCTSSSTFSMLQHVFRLKCRSWAAFGNGTLVAPFRRHNVMRFDMRLKHFTILHRSFALVGWAIIRDHLGTCRPSTDRPTDRPHLIYFNNERDRQDCRRGCSCHVYMYLSLYPAISPSFYHSRSLRKRQHVDFVIIEQLDVVQCTTAMRWDMKVREWERERKNQALWLNWIVHRHSFYYLCLVSLQLHSFYVNLILIGNKMCATASIQHHVPQAF